MSSMSAKGSQPSLNTRQRILDVSARLFAERGYDRTTVRDIASELGISNPSLYYHFESKEAILLELLSEPLMRVQAAVAEAEHLTGEARTRRIVGGLLEALEVHSGIALASSRELAPLADRLRLSPTEKGFTIEDLLAEGVAADRRDLRLSMAIGAVEGVVRGIMRNSDNADEFVAQLRAQRDDIVDLVLQILR